LAARSSVLAGALLLAVLASCSLTRTSVDSCSANGDCRAGFGIGSICGADGLCQRAPPNPRCTRTFPEDLLTRPESYPNAIVVGSLVVGSIESQRARENATRLAIKEVNEQRGLDGRLFGVVFCDVAEDPKFDSLKREEAVIATGNFLTDVIGVPAIVGPSASPDVVAVFNALKGKGVLIISPSATSPELTTVDVPQASDAQPGLLWRTAVPDTEQGKAIATYLASDKRNPAVNNVSVVFEKGAYGEGLEKVFREAFSQKKPGTTITSKGFTAGNTGERNAAVFDAATPGPQYVLFFSSQSGDQSAFVVGVKDLASYQNVSLFLSDTAANADLLNNASSASSVFPKIRGTRPYVPDEEKDRVYGLFKLSYQIAFNDDPGRFTFVPHAYDATWLVLYGSAYALRREQKITGLGIAHGLRHIAPGNDGALDLVPGSWKQISDDLGNDKPVKLTGASGDLDYDPSTEETTGTIEFWRISPDGKQIVEIDPAEL
jgi:ABC-type branched-subunit amino acid transport system substrate-binding protein